MVTVVGTPSIVIPSTAPGGPATRTVLRRLIAGPQGLGGLFTGVAQDGGALQGERRLVDASPDGLQDEAYDADRFEGAWLYTVATGSGATYVAPELHRIAAYDPAEGSLTIGRPFASQPVSGVTPYEVHTHGVSVDAIHDAIDWGTDVARFDAWFAIPGLVPDGDMQRSTTASWGAPSACTATKVVGDDGVRLLRVNATSDASYLPTVGMPVVAGRILRVYASVTPASGRTCTVIAWDATAGTTIDIAWGGTVSQATSGRTYIGGRLEVPTGCTSLSLRLMGGGDWHHVALYDVAHRQLTLPLWCVPYDQFILGVAWASRYGTSSADDRDLVTIPSPPRPEGGIWRLAPGDYGGLIMVHASVPFPRLIADDDAIPATATRYVLLASLAYLYRSLTRPRTMDTARFEAARAQALKDWQAMQMARNPLARWRPRWSST